MLPDLPDLKTCNNSGFGNENRKQPVDRARRNALKIIVAGTAAAGSLAIPSRWSKPVVNSIILPVHAQATNADAPTAATTLPAQANTNSCTCFEVHYPMWDDSYTTQAFVTTPPEVAPGSQRSAVQGKKRKK